MRQRFLLSLFLFVAVAVPGSFAANLTPDQAKDHVGENATVCGVVATTHFAANSQDTPTFVNLDKPYPHQVFTIVIWGSDLAKFDQKPDTWERKRICSTGTISLYRGTPEMIVKLPRQISVEK